MLALWLSLTALAADVPAAAEGLGRGVHVVVTETVDAPPEVVWSHFADDFAGIAAWSEGVSASRPMTSADLPAGFAPDADAPLIGRVVTVNGRDQSHTLVDFDAAGRTLTFRSGELPRVLAYAQNTHRIEPTEDGGTRLTIDAYLVPVGVAKLMRGVIERKFTGYMEAYVGEARTAIEDASADLGGAR
ncbi:MAG: hypothetical protein EP330_26995 [Deltaproteobacteria bacterium]|nr:MAG: hypothetical protein EP330_26995 [Deltaproteobacteria bacterium]